MSKIRRNFKIFFNIIVKYNQKNIIKKINYVVLEYICTKKGCNIRFFSKKHFSIKCATFIFKIKKDLNIDNKKNKST
jgi:hypothetical protein